MLTRERQSHVREPLLPLPAPLPGLPAALSRRRVIFGAVTATGLLAGSAARGAGLLASGSVPAATTASAPADARLVAIADELEAAFRWVAAYPSLGMDDDEESHPEYYAMIGRFGPIEDELAATPADTMVGILAKARAMQVPTVRDCAHFEVSNSLADDLVRLHSTVVPS